MSIYEHLQTLGAQDALDLRDVKTAFRRLAIRYHPDKSREANAAEHFKRIAAAYAEIEAYAQRGGGFPAPRPTPTPQIVPSGCAPPKPTSARTGPANTVHPRTPQRVHIQTPMPPPQPVYRRVYDPAAAAAYHYEEAVDALKRERATPIEVTGRMFGSAVGLFLEPEIDLSEAYTIFDRVCQELESQGVQVPSNATPPGLPLRRREVERGLLLPGSSAHRLPAPQASPPPGKIVVSNSLVCPLPQPGQRKVFGVAGRKRRR